MARSNTVEAWYRAWARACLAPGCPPAIAHELEHAFYCGVWVMLEQYAAEEIEGLSFNARHAVRESLQEELITFFNTYSDARHSLFQSPHRPGHA